MFDIEATSSFKSPVENRSFFPDLPYFSVPFRGSTSTVPALDILVRPLFNCLGVDHSKVSISRPRAGNVDVLGRDTAPGTLFNQFECPRSQTPPPRTSLSSLFCSSLILTDLKQYHLVKRSQPQVLKSLADQSFQNYELINICTVSYDN